MLSAGISWNRLEKTLCLKGSRRLIWDLNYICKSPPQLHLD